jgi:mono/diheme cytochrome c family protein
MARKTPGGPRPGSPKVQVPVAWLLLAVAVVLAVALLLPRGGGGPPPAPPSPDLNSTLVARGERVFTTPGSCVSCHGERGAGVRDAGGNFLAPPLDESAHAWHHSDEALSRFILYGLPGGMPAWRERGLTDEDARALVEYIKSLWRPEVRAECQGAKHMSAECATVFRG